MNRVSVMKVSVEQLEVIGVTGQYGFVVRSRQIRAPNSIVIVAYGIEMDHLFICPTQRQYYKASLIAAHRRPQQRLTHVPNTSPCSTVSGSAFPLVSGSSSASRPATIEVAPNRITGRYRYASAPCNSRRKAWESLKFDTTALS